MALFRTIKTHRVLIGQLVLRDLKLKYRGSLAGYLWTLLEPLLLVLVYYAVFTVLAGWRRPNYFLIVILGVLPYTFFSGLIQHGARALLSNAPVIRRFYVPREVFVFSTAGSQLLVLCLSALAVLPLLIYFQLLPGWRILLTVASTLLLLLFGTGIALAASCANVVFRDVEYLLAIGLRVAFYLVPTVYTLEQLPPAWRDAYLCNPLAVYLYLFRYGVMVGHFELSAVHVLLAVLAAVVTFAAGYWMFARWEGAVVKYL